MGKGFAHDIIIVTPSITRDGTTTTDGETTTPSRPLTSCSDFMVQFSSKSVRANLALFRKTAAAATPAPVRVDVSINGRGPVPELAMSLGDDGTCRFLTGQSFKPPVDALERLVATKLVTPGRNLVQYVYDKNQKFPGDDDGGSGGAVRYRRGLITAEAHLYVWSVSDSVIVSDIDGTITKSDVMGVVDTILTEKYCYAHRGVCKFFSDLSCVTLSSSPRDGAGSSSSGSANVCSDEDNNGSGSSSSHDSSPPPPPGSIRILYLTARPMKVMQYTRKFITQLKQRDESGGQKSATRCHLLPPGPIFCQPKTLSEVIYSELWAKTQHEFKADVLSRQVIIPFAAAGRKSSNNLFLAGFGNKDTDAKAYSMAGMQQQDIYIVNTLSQITCMGKEDEENENNIVNGANGKCLPCRRKKDNQGQECETVCFGSYDDVLFDQDVRRKIDRKVKLCIENGVFG